MSLTVAELASALQSVFTTGADDAAGATGFIRRRRLLGGASFVQALTSGWLANPNAPIRLRCQVPRDIANSLGAA